MEVGDWKESVTRKGRADGDRDRNRQAERKGSEGRKREANVGVIKTVADKEKEMKEK